MTYQALLCQSCIQKKSTMIGITTLMKHPWYILSCYYTILLAHMHFFADWPHIIQCFLCLLKLLPPTATGRYSKTRQSSDQRVNSFILFTRVNLNEKRKYLKLNLRHIIGLHIGQYIIRQHQSIYCGIWIKPGVDRKVLHSSRWLRYWYTTRMEFRQCFRFIFQSSFCIQCQLQRQFTNVSSILWKICV